MADAITPLLMNTGAGSDGMFGGNGLIGGLILGSLLRNNGNLFGGSGDAAVGAAATQAGVQNVVNDSAVMGQLADIKASIPFNEAQVQLALAQTQTALTQQITAGDAAAALRDSSIQTTLATGFGNMTTNLGTALASITNSVNQVGSAVAQNKFDITQAITADGDRTRSLITSQYEATLNRQLTEANAALIALKADSNLATTQRNIEITTTNNINQVQAQQQQQQQFQALAGLVSNLANDLQYIRATNQAINIGSGAQTANPLNNNTNVRA